MQDSTNSTAQKILASPSGGYALLCSDVGYLTELVREIRLSLCETHAFERFDLSDPTMLAALFEQIQSPDLFSPKRILFGAGLPVLKAPALKSVRDAVFAHPQQSDLVLLTFPNKTQACSAVPSGEHERRVLSIGGLDEAQFRVWAKRVAESEGIKKITPRALQSLYTFSEGDLPRARIVIEQLAAFLGGKPCEGPEIYELFSAHPDPDEFALIDAICSRDVVQIEHQLWELRRAGRNVFLIIGLLSKMYARYFVLGELLRSGLSESEIQLRLKMKPWAFKKGREVASAYSSSRLRGVLHQFVGVDMRLKGRSLEEHVILRDVAMALVP